VVLTLDLGDSGPVAPPWLAVLRGEGDLAGVLLDAVEDIRDLPPPPAAGGTGAPLVSGVVQDDRGAVAVLDPGRLRAAVEAAASAGMEDGGSEDRNGA